MEYERFIILFGKEEVMEYFACDYEMSEEIGAIKGEVKLVILLNDTEKVANYELFVSNDGGLNWEEHGTEDDDYEAVLQSAEEYNWEILED